MADQSLQDRPKLSPHRHRVRRSSANVVHLSGDDVNVGDGGVVSIEQVVNEKHIAHLLAVAVNGDGLGSDGGDDKPGHPALILDPHLPWPIDA